MQENASLLDSPPVLQNPSPYGVTVVWAVNKLATGWVEYGATPELGKRADASTFGQHVVDDTFIHVRITDLQPGEVVYYRIASAPVEFGDGSKVICGEPQFGAVHRWKSLDADAEQASFTVINDTHEREDLIPILMEQIADKPADFTIWNGDIFNSVHDKGQIVSQVLRPSNADYATEQPVLFTSGNHDYRGPHSRTLAQAITPWQENQPAGRCFALRQGPLAIIGLDTSEDKPDRHPIFSGLTSHEAYRELQRDWLKSALRRPEIQNAPYLVTICHIPLWGREGDNPGDTLEGYARYCRNAQQLWHPLLQEAGVQFLITGHRHHYDYYEPTAERSYGQLITSGPNLDQATIVRAHADASKLEIVVRNLEQEEWGRWEFTPRQ